MGMNDGLETIVYYKRLCVVSLILLINRVYVTHIFSEILIDIIGLDNASLRELSIVLNKLFI